MRTGILGVVLLAGCVHEPVGTDDELMRMIEHNITLPDGAAPLPRYRRYYAWTSGDQQIVEAVYTLGGKPSRLWLSANDLPIVLDGGCSVITFKFEVTSKSVRDLNCNGN